MKTKLPPPNDDGRKKRVADGEEPAVRIPLIVEIVQVEVALDAIPIQIGHVTAPDRAVIIRSMPPKSPPLEYSQG